MDNLWKRIKLMSCIFLLIIPIVFSAYTIRFETDGGEINLNTSILQGTNISCNDIIVDSGDPCNPGGAGGSSNTNNYTSAISFNNSGNIFWLNLERVGLANLSASFTVSVVDTNETPRFENLTATDCTGSDFMIGVENNGSVKCDTPTGTGDITAVNTNGKYLTGGAASGDVSLLLNETELNATTNTSIDLRVTQSFMEGLGFNITTDLQTLFDTLYLGIGNTDLANFTNTPGYFNNLSNFTQNLTDNKICIYNQTNDRLQCDYTDQDSGPDNLGNHIATQDLNMSDNNITGVSNINPNTGKNVTINPFSTGNILNNEFDLIVGGMGAGAIRVGNTDIASGGNMSIGAATFNGTLLFLINGTVPSVFEFVVGRIGETIRLAIPKPQAGYAMQTVRSLMVGGVNAGAFNDNIINCTAQGYRFIDCASDITGADAGIQDDIEFWGSLFGGNGTWNVTDDGNLTTAGKGDFSLILSKSWVNTTIPSSQVTDFNSTVQDLSLNKTEADLIYLNLSGKNANQNINISPYNATAGTYFGIGGELALARLDDTTNFKSIQDIQNLFHSSGVFNSNISVNFILLNDDNTFNVTSGSGTIRASDNATGDLLFFDWVASNNIAIALNEVIYVGVEYNAGSPQVVTKSTYTWDTQTDFPLGSIVRDVSGVHLQREDHAVGDHANNMILRLFDTLPFSRDNRGGGLIIGTSGLNITVTAGTLWEKLNKFPIDAIDTSSSDTFDRYYRNGSGGWFAQEDQTNWNNTHYDDGTGTLATLSNNRWSVEWVYLEVDGEIVTVFGQEQTLSEGAAEALSPPSTLPDRLQIHSVLIGRIIFQESATTAAATQSVYVTTFSVAGVVDHGDLAGLSDDDHTQYLLADGTRALTANWGQGIFNITNFNGWFLGITNYSKADGRPVYLTNFSDNLGHVEDNATWNKSLADTLYPDIDSPDFINMTIDGKIFHDGDLDTFIFFQTDVVDFNIGGDLNIRFSNNVGVEQGAIFNELGRSAFNFRIESNTQDYMFFINSSIDRIGINTQFPEHSLDVNGTLQATSILSSGDFNVNEKFNVTASNGNTNIAGNTTINGLNIVRLNSTHWKIFGS